MLRAVVLCVYLVTTACTGGSSAAPAKAAPSTDVVAAIAPTTATMHTPTEAVPTQEPASTSAAPEFNPRLLRRFKPLRSELAAVKPPQKLVDLGRMLYFDARLSANNEVSCNSCHPLDHYGSDGKRTSLGVGGHTGTRNAPSTYNAAGLIAQFWDGRAPDVERQAVGPIMNPIEMGSTPERVKRTLSSMPEYRERFTAAFPGTQDPVNATNAGIAIAAFERGLVTPSRWDRYLDGDHAALTAAEISGLRVFTNIGCMVCHTGEFLGGSSFQPVGAVEQWPNQQDRGRIAITNNPSDDMVFRVPSLRNVEMTAPYFHDGSATTLEQAVAMMARYQLGTELQPTQRAAIVSWLKSLTGVPPADYIKAPPLPPSTATTPGPVADPVAQATPTRSG